ncbi:MAG: N-acetyl-gamma-glutamyl-phosphate reductase [Actinobacteria bacterium]|nr:N-acetyl-gamma-glutamyl-phosphate reductase [Actinomycetota bacterium]
MIRAGIVGASGYTGAELMRILSLHPEMEVTVATANRYQGECIGALYPSLDRFYPGVFKAYEPEAIDEGCDVVFLGLPHGESMKALPELASMEKKVVDLSADLRFDDPDEYERWYGEEHACPGLSGKAVYGLTEVYRDRVAAAGLVANPGCYPTGALLGLIPAAEAGYIAGTVVVDAKSGISGAGRKATPATHFPQASENVAPYAVSGHRHMPEIISGLEKVSGKPVAIVFAPHLVPMSRGILCTMYVPLGTSTGAGEIRDSYQEFYRGERFVRVLEEGAYPQTKAVQGSNNCHIAVEVTGEGRMLVVMSAIDNLVKGASGQAVQNMNLMCGLPEWMGLESPGLFP